MKYELDIVHETVVRHQAADALSRLPTEKADGSDINEYISILDLCTRAQKRLNKNTNDSLEQTQIKAKEPQLSAFHEFMNTQRTDVCCYKSCPPVEILRYSV